MPEFLSSSTFLISAVAVLAVLLILILGYLKAPPDTAYVISGPVSYTHLDVYKRQPYRRETMHCPLFRTGFWF